jgi:DNA-binding transcriptional MerR regulator
MSDIQIPIKIQLPPVPGLTLPAVAYCARIAPDVLRHWFDRKQVTTIVPPQHAPRAYRRFQPADVVRLAVIGRLVAFGFTLAEAHEIVVQYVDSALWAVVSICGDIPWFLLRGRLYDFELVISRERGGEVSVTRRGRRDDRPSFAWLTLDVGQICSDVESRVADAGARA